MGIIDFRVRLLWGGYRALVQSGTADRFLVENIQGWNLLPDSQALSLPQQCGGTFEVAGIGGEMPCKVGKNMG